MAQENLDPPFEILDLPGELKSEAGLDGDVVRELTEVNLAVVPQEQLFGCCFEQRDRVVLTVVTM